MGTFTQWTGDVGVPVRKLSYPGGKWLSPGTQATFLITKDLCLSNMLA